MNTYDLSFGKITILREDVAEITINDGIEVSSDQVDEGDTFIKKHLRAPFAIIFNKINNYSFHYDAQIKLGAYTELNAIAVVCYRKASYALTEVLGSIPRDVPWNMQTFANHQDALAWILSEQEKISLD